VIILDKELTISEALDVLVANSFCCNNNLTCEDCHFHRSIILCNDNAVCIDWVDKIPQAIQIVKTFRTVNNI
jgi:hypothetical protein